jgi:hypothetical protein
MVLRFDILTSVLLKVCLLGCDDLLMGGYFLAFRGIKQSWTEEYECLTPKMEAL